MKSTNTIEHALNMYKETVSPPEETFSVILSQIPEQQKQKGGRVVRSPYTWYAVTQTMMLCSIMLIVASAIVTPSYQSNPFYLIDKEVDEFEISINQEDYEKSILDATL